MSYILNALYLFALIVLSPWLLYKAIRTGKYQERLWDRCLGTAPDLPSPTRPRVWLHGVSVGEIHLLRQLVAAISQRHPDWEIVLSTTTDTGFEEAKKNFPTLPLFSFPFDFSWAVAAAMQHVKPSLIVLAECELWPNFLAAARHLRIPVMVANGRMSPRSAGRYRKLKWLARPLLSSLDLIAVQSEQYAKVFRELGVSGERVHVTGSVKYDGAQSDRQQPKTQELRQLLGIANDSLVWVCGSTQAPEEALALDIYRRLRTRFPTVRLILVPRQRERFDEVASLLERDQVAFVRRSTLRGEVPSDAVILLDTIGELSAVWGLADVAFVGGSLDGKRGGQNVIEPAAYGAAVLFGPYVWNFADPVRMLLASKAAIQIKDAKELETAVRRLLTDGSERQRLGNAARQLVRSQQGATGHTIALIEKLLHAQMCYRHAA